MDRGLLLVQYLFSDLMDESITPDNEFLFNKIKDLESASAPSPSYHPGAGETSVETSGIDYSDFAFGFSLNPDGDNTAEIGINAGKVRHGTRTAVSVSSAKIVCSNQTWIFVAYTYGSTGTISSSASEPVDTETVHNHALYLVTITSGVASVESGDIKHLGDIFIPGAFA